MKRNQILLIIALTALISLGAYYYIAFQLSSQQQALEMRGTIEAIRNGE